MVRYINFSRIMYWAIQKNCALPPKRIADFQTFSIEFGSGFPGKFIRNSVLTQLWHGGGMILVWCRQGFYIVVVRFGNGSGMV